MPTIVRRNESTHRAKTLTEELANALSSPSVRQGMPLIIENRIAQTSSTHVVVIWDDWADMSPTERSKIILDAFAKRKRARTTTITVAMGLTSEEALRMKFLPYSIVTTRRKGDRPSLEELAKAMASAGGVVVKVGSSMQLRFATLDQAEDAYRLLSQKVPGPYFAILREQSVDE